MTAPVDPTRRDGLLDNHETVFYEKSEVWPHDLPVFGVAVLSRAIVALAGG
jgi:hypothetical protein